MSTIEKFMRNFDTPAPLADVAIEKASARTNWRRPAAQFEHGNGLEQPLSDATPALSLDYDFLRRKGVIASAGEASRVNDEFRRIKRPLLANAAGTGGFALDQGNIIMVTSSVAGEGKTHTSINLALNMARELDYTVLLVDADIIKRETSELLGIKDKPGLMDLLHNGSLLIEDTVLSTDVPRLSVMPAGQWHDQATELLSSDEMRRLVSELATRYPRRMVIFDSPPLLATAEAQVLAELMGQIVLVIEALSTPTNVVTEAVALLDKAKPIGLVLNKSRQLLATDHYGGYYKYQS